MSANKKKCCCEEEQGVLCPALPPANPCIDCNPIQTFLVLDASASVWRVGDVEPCCTFVGSFQFDTNANNGFCYITLFNADTGEPLPCGASEFTTSQFFCVVIESLAWWVFQFDTGMACPGDKSPPNSGAGCRFKYRIPKIEGELCPPIGEYPFWEFVDLSNIEDFDRFTTLVDGGTLVVS